MIPQLWHRYTGKERIVYSIAQSSLTQTSQPSGHRPLPVQTMGLDNKEFYYYGQKSF
jgi:hypothetical protein